MSSMLARSAFRAARPLQPAQARAFNTSRALRQEGPGASDKKQGTEALKTGARRDPELLVLFAIMTGVFGLAGWHFSRSPTSATSEHKVGKAPNSEPWKSGSEGKYQFHPGGDPRNPPKDAPSALNKVIIPNVNLPKELHDRFNKYGKEDW